MFLEDNLRLLIKISTLYYGDNLTQDEISKKLNISRPAVSRLLKKAREEGIVEIKINSSYGYSNLEEALEKRFGLKEAIVIEYQNEEQGILKRELGKAAAALLMRIIKNKDIVGLSWGTTLASIPPFIKQKYTPDALFVPMVGGIGQVNYDVHSNNITTEFAKAFGGKWQLLHAPAFVDRMDVKKSILSDTNVKRVLDTAANADIAVVGIGAPIESSTMLASGYFGESEIKLLKEAGAIGDLCSRFFDRDGNPCDVDINDRVIGIPLHILKDINTVVGVAGGKEKVLSILGALKGGYIDIIVTDNLTAGELIKGVS
ncbi:sugar-binding transcriptional regulator [Calorimonas adulescens]|uniref:Sugar-binding transcriptional regulator n=1 Tax=Calorimonas adulescens TaxID=2606906 RepID=A0A5D8QAI6_9THEO|nr:sugar-binding transcriptional regulator [Calorimonas adulescens]